MKLPVFLSRSCVLGVASAILAASAFAADPLYSNDFTAAAAGKAPSDFMITAGEFTVKEGSEKFLELPGAPLDTFGLLFGPSQPADVSASARFFGTKAGRKFPTFGISLNGVAGYRLQISPGKKALELYKGDEAKASVPFEWASGTWVKLKIQVRKGADGYTITGKAWAADAAEPADWLIKADEKENLPAGRAGIWGSPYAGTPIRFDDLLVEAAK